MLRKIVLANHVIQRFILKLTIYIHYMHVFAMLYFDFIFHSDELSIDINELIFEVKTHIHVCEQLPSQKIIQGK